MEEIDYKHIDELLNQINADIEDLTRNVKQIKKYLDLD